MSRRLRFGHSLCACAAIFAISRGAEAEEPVDGSLTTKEYTDAGLPALDHAWDVEEIPAISKVLKSLSDKNPALLPRRASPKSGKVFERLTAPDNWASARDKVNSAESRRTLAAGTLKALNSIAGLYSALLEKPGAPEGEFIDLMGAVLRLAGAMVDAQVEMRGVDPKDPNYEKRTAELNQIGNGFAISLLSCADVLADRDNFSKDSRLRLCSILRETFPALIPSISDTKKQEILSKLKTCGESEREEAIKKAIESVADLVKTGAGPSK